MILGVSAFLFIAAIALFLITARRQNSIGLPAGRVIYTDTRTWGKVEQPLFDAELGLVGKPDYLVDSGGQIIPVEVKSTPVASAPYDAHLYQLAAYCLLVERRMGKRPAYGILHYPNRTYAIDYTPRLEAELLALLAEMHAQDRKKETPRSHSSAARCSRCGYRHACDQRLQ